jgi:hypothetical protein
MALTITSGANYLAAYVTVPGSKVGNGEKGGVKYVIREKFTFDADGAASETVKLGRLPAGAMVLNARVFGPDLGGTGTSTLGNSASVDGSATDAALATSLITTIDHSGQAFDVSDYTSRGAGIGITRFSREVDINWVLTGVTSGATGKIVYLELEYIVI